MPSFAGKTQIFDYADRAIRTVEDIETLRRNRDLQDIQAGRDTVRFGWERQEQPYKFTKMKADAAASAYPGAGVGGAAVTGAPSARGGGAASPQGVEANPWGGGPGPQGAVSPSTMNREKAEKQKQDQIDADLAKKAPASQEPFIKEFDDPVVQGRVMSRLQGEGLVEQDGNWSMKNRNAAILRYHVDKPFGDYIDNEYREMMRARADGLQGEFQKAYKKYEDAPWDKELAAKAVEAEKKAKKAADDYQGAVARTSESMTKRNAYDTIKKYAEARGENFQQWMDRHPETFAALMAGNTEKFAEAVGKGAEKDESQNKIIGSMEDYRRRVSEMPEGQEKEMAVRRMNYVMNNQGVIAAANSGDLKAFEAASSRAEQEISDIIQSEIRAKALTSTATIKAEADKEKARITAQARKDATEATKGIKSADQAMREISRLTDIMNKAADTYAKTGNYDAYVYTTETARFTIDALQKKFGIDPGYRERSSQKIKHIQFQQAFGIGRDEYNRLRKQGNVEEAYRMRQNLEMMYEQAIVDGTISPSESFESMVGDTPSLRQGR